MGAIWQLRLKGQDGLLDLLLDDYDSFTLTRRVNSAGAYALRFAKRAKQTLAEFQARADLFALDAQLEFWRAWPEMGIDWYLEFEALHRWPHWYVREDGALVFESGGRGYIDLPNRRIVAAASGSAEAKKVGPAETVMKEFVDEQCGPGAGARAITGLSVEADGAHGNTVSLPAAYDNVLETVQALARTGGGDFDVIGTGAGTYEFRWYTGQRGTDRHTTVTFALGLGNMAHPHLRYPRQDEINAVLVGGQGEGGDRETLWRSTAGLIDDSPWNRHEAFRDARHVTYGDTDSLNALGDARLDQGKPRYELTFDVLQTPACLYGKHYTLGDLVTSQFLSFSGTQKVQAVTFTVDSDRAEQVTVEMRDV